MDVMLQRHCARFIYIVPDGLRELLTDISREVLRTQPEDIYTFIADYLDALLITRENARIAAKFVTHMAEASETIVGLLQRTGMSREEVDKTAEVIQDAFRSWSERKGILKEDEDEVIAKIIHDAGISETQVHAAASVIQHAFKAFKLRQSKESQLLSGIIDWRVAARSAIKLYRRCGVTPEEATRAANLIKAAYKGYYTRRAIRILNEEQTVSEEAVEEATVEEEGGSYYSDSTSMDRKKGVRIDYTSVVPHVDFGDEELISRELTTEVELIEGVVEPAPPADFMMRIWGEADEVPLKAKPVDETQEFVRKLLLNLLDRVDAGSMEEKLGVILEDTNSEILVTPIGEKSPYARLSEQPPTQQALEQELIEAKEEMLSLKGSSKASKGSAEEVKSVSDTMGVDHKEQDELPVPAEEQPHEEDRSKPHEEKSEPHEEISEPHEEKSEPQEETSEPHEDKSEPHEEKSEPHEEKSEPHEEKSEAHEEKSELHEEKSEPHEEKSEPHEEKSEPQEEKAEPQEEKAEPQEVDESTVPPTEQGNAGDVVEPPIDEEAVD